VSCTGSPYVMVYNVADWSTVTLTGGNPAGVGYQTHWSPEAASWPWAMPPRRF